MLAGKGKGTDSFNIVPLGPQTSDAHIMSIVNGSVGTGFLDGETRIFTCKVMYILLLLYACTFLILKSTCYITCSVPQSWTHRKFVEMYHT